MSKKENNKYESLFEPLKIGGVIVKNRFFMSPMGNFGHVDAEGALTDEGIDYYVERAKGGIGLIITGYCIADEAIEEAETPSILVIKKNPLIFIQKCSQLTERVHAYGTKIFLQLTAGFGRTAKVVKVNKKIAPSDAANMYDPSIVEFTDQIMGGTKNAPVGDIEMAHLYADYYKMHMNMNTKATEISGNSVKIEGVKDGSRDEIPSDTVLIAVGYESVNDIYPNFVKNTSVPEVYNVGDSNHVANIYYAIHDAYELANNI